MRGWRISPVAWSVLLALGALGLYLVKYQVQSVRDDVTRLERELAAEREAVALLEAEWAYLNRPARLERLAGQHLALSAPDSRRVVEWQDIPLRPQSVAAKSEGQ